MAAVAKHVHFVYPLCVVTDPASNDAIWFAEHVLPHEPMLRAWLRARFPEIGEFDDIVQDAFARLPPGVRLVTARTVEGIAPYPGQARCLALGFWPECFRRLNVKGGRRPFPEETRSAFDIEGKHVTIQGPSPDLSPARPFNLSPAAKTF